jgi:hypothetical protein
LQLQAQAGERREYIHFRHRSISLTQTA